MRQTTPLLLFLALAACEPAPPDDPGEAAPDELRAIDPDDPEPVDRCPNTNPCIERSWTGTRCRDVRAPDGAACFDGNVCDGTSTCQRGQCVSDNVPLRCDDGNACTGDRCEPTSGCQHDSTTGNVCSDGLSCTVADLCEAGRCVGHGNTNGVPTAPSFSDVAVFAPFGELAQYAGNYYLEGEAMDVRATLPSCAYVTGVELDGVRIDTRPHTACDDVGPVDCQPAYYEIVWAFPRTNGTLDTIVRVHFGGPGSSGDAVDVSLIASSAVGDTRTTLTVSRVADVVPANHATQRLALTISETRLSNSVVKSTYARYGDAGRYVHDDGTALTDPAYGSLLVDVEPTGIHFISRVTLDRTCHPQARVEGRFVLAKTDDGIRVQWTEGPSIPITIDPLCNIVTLGLVDVIADFIYDGEVQAMADREIQAQVDAALGAACNALCRSQIAGFQYTHDEIRVLIKPLTDAVVVDVPYWRRTPDAVPTHGFPMAAPATYVLIGSGVARQSVCRPGSTSPVCGGQQMIGPEGTFVWERPYDATNGSAIPDPWDNGDGPAAYFAQRAAARGRLRGAYRDLTRLSTARIHAGALTVRGAVSERSLLRPCGYEPLLARERVVFGTNEPGDASYGDGTRRVAVLFAPTVGLSECW